MVGLAADAVEHVGAPVRKAAVAHVGCVASALVLEDWALEGGVAPVGKAADADTWCVATARNAEVSAGC